MFDTPPLPRRPRAHWLAAFAVFALFLLALVTIHLQSRVTQLRYRVAHLGDRCRLWLEHVQAEELEVARLSTPPRLRAALGARHDSIAISLFRKPESVTEPVE